MAVGLKTRDRRGYTRTLFIGMKRSGSLELNVGDKVMRTSELNMRVYYFGLTEN